MVTRNGAAWMDLLSDGLDPDGDIVERDGEWELHSPVGVRLAQVIHHGTDHRSQVCTALSTLAWRRRSSTCGHLPGRPVASGSWRSRHGRCLGSRAVDVTVVYPVSVTPSALTMRAIWAMCARSCPAIHDP